MFKIEFDDGKPLILKDRMKEDRIKTVVPKGRPYGFYVIYPDGKEELLKIGYVKISEIKGLEDLLNRAWLLGRSV